MMCAQANAELRTPMIADKGASYLSRHIRHFSTLAMLRGHDRLVEKAATPNLHLVAAHLVAGSAREAG